MTPELFDIVELLVNVPAHNLFIGTQGAIVECHSDRDFEVEFADQNGETQALCTLTHRDFIVVWRASTKQWLNASEKVIAILNQLSEGEREEILNYARFIYQKV